MCSTSRSTPRTVHLGYRRFVGAIMTANFLAFWAAPIVFMGQAWKLCLQYPLRPLYTWLDNCGALRRFAESHVYSKPKYADFFAISLLATASALAALGTVYHYQMTHGRLAWWVIYAYYFAWVGLGGRTMGAAYTLAHKEGHNAMLYKKGIRNVVGNWFEDGLGVFYGSVPSNFTASHVHIHHKLDGGKGDTFYQFDLDRSSWADLMLFQHRVLMHTTGWSSLRFFRHMGRDKMAQKLRHGMVMYWLVYPALLLVATRGSLSFVFWIYLQPLFCMTYFLAFINFGFHGFVEFDAAGKQKACVNATTIIGGDDDYFGEDDHMAHHYATSVYHSDLPAHQQAQLAEWREHKASVFRELSIIELSLFMLIKDWDRLADHYVDFSEEKMTKEGIKALLQERVARKEMEPEDYIAFLMDREANFQVRARKASIGSRFGETKTIPGQ